MRVLHVKTPQAKKPQVKRRFVPSHDRRNSHRQATQSVDLSFLTRSIDFRSKGIIPNDTLFDENDNDLQISLYSFLGREKNPPKRVATPTLDHLRESVAAEAGESVKSEFRLSTHLSPDARLRYSPEIAVAERALQKQCSNWTNLPTVPGRLARLFPKQLQRRPSSQYARSERSWDSRSSVAGSVL
jgi:hypothetical protein